MEDPTMDDSKDCDFQAEDFEEDEAEGVDDDEEFKPAPLSERAWDDATVKTMIELYGKHANIVSKRGIWSRVARDLNKAFDKKFSPVHVKKKWHTLKNRCLEGNTKTQHYTLMLDVLKNSRYAKTVDGSFGDDGGLPSQTRAPEWFMSLVYGFQECMAQQHEERLRELRKLRKEEQKRNRLLKQLMDRMEPYLGAAAAFSTNMASAMPNLTVTVSNPHAAAASYTSNG